jgi:hypothetical protein
MFNYCECVGQSTNSKCALMHTVSASCQSLLCMMENSCGLRARQCSCVWLTAWWNFFTWLFRIFIDVNVLEDKGQNFFFVVCLFVETVLLCSPVWPQICDLPASVSWGLGLQVPSHLALSLLFWYILPIWKYLIPSDFSNIALLSVITAS